MPVFQPKYTGTKPSTSEKGPVVFDCWLDPHFDPMAVLSNLYEQINGGFPYVDQTGFYLDPLLSLNWSQVSRQKEYDAGSRSMPYSAASDMITHALVHGQGIHEVDLIVLGPGEADAEAVLARHMAPFFQSMRVFLVEASDTLLRSAKKTMSQALAGITHTSVLGIAGDILHLWQYLDQISPPSPTRRRVVVAFTVLLNLQDELHFIQNNFVRLNQGDLFVFDFWQALGPLDRQDQINKLEPRLAGTKPRAGWDQALDEWHYNILRRYCEGFEEVEFGYKLGLSGCPIPDSYAIDKMANVHRRDGSHLKLLIQRYKRYNPDSLVLCLKKEGLLPINIWHSRASKSHSLYLFEKVTPSFTDFP